MPVRQNFANSQALVDVEDIKESTLILKNGGMKQILMVEGLNFALKSEDEQNIITSSYQNFLNSLDFSIQIVVHSRKININKYLSDLEEKMAGETSSLLKNQIAEYKEFVRKFVEDNAIMEKSFLVVIPWYRPITPSKNSMLGAIPFLNKKQDKNAMDLAAKENEEIFHQNLLQLRQRVDQVIEGFSSIGMQSIVLNDEELAELMYNFYNPETIEKGKIKLEEKNG